MELFNKEKGRINPPFLLFLVFKWIHCSCKNFEELKDKIDKYFLEITNTKCPAILYIEDRALTFNGNFNETLLQVYNFKTFWENVVN